MNPFRGTWTALLTPFRGGQVEFAAFERHVERQIAGGVDGLVPCGTTGESPTLSADEQRELIRCCVRVAAGRVPVLAGAGSNSTQHATHLAEAAIEAGAAGVMVVAPYYNRPSQEGLFQHFAAVARAVAAPIVIYNIPGRCGVEISAPTLQRLGESFENIVAVKHATGRVDGAADLLAASRLAVLSGDDPLTLPLMSLGAIGVVSVLSNLIPASVKRLTRAALDGRWSDALAAHRAIYTFGKRLLALDTNPIPIKTAAALRGWCPDEFRLPMCPLSQENRETLRELLEEYAALT